MTYILERHKKSVKRTILKYFHRGQVDFFLVGFQKCSTSSLWSSIRFHNSVNPGNKKEYDFWNEKNPELVNELDYRACYPLKKGDQKFVDGSINYITTPGTVSKILEYNPQAKFIILLRDPTERAYSAWKMMHIKFNDMREIYNELVYDPRSFQTAISDELHAFIKQEASPGLWNWNYLRTGLYAPILKQELASVPSKNILIADAESDLKNNWDSFQRTLQEFLGLPYEPLKLEHRNKTVKTEITFEEQEALARLRRFYKPYNDELRAHLNRPFQNWSS